jgi:hypothetical protein
MDPDPRIDDLRQQLKSLGYLDAGVDRFLLAPARGTRGPVAVAARSGVRVGILGGALLGPAAVIGLGARVPGLVSGVRDALVLALYLGAVFFLAVAVTSFLLSLGATALVRGRDERFAKRARLASADAGWIITAACLVYLTFWWRNANAGFGWSAPIWTAFALVVAVGISLLLGHAVRITTLAVLATRRAAQLPPVPATSWRVLIGGGALAFAGAAYLLVLTAADAPSAVDHPPLTVVSQGISVRLIAIDGFDPAIYDSVRQSGPGGTVSLFDTRFQLEPQDPSDPARAWTTIATGQPADVHGVHGIETTRLAGVQGTVTAATGTLARAIRAATDVIRLTRPSIASRDERRSKTLWEVAEESGLRTAVINWWATWPAPPAGGIVITDRAVLRLEHGGPLDAEIAPASLYPVLRQAWPSVRKRASDEAEAAFAGVADQATRSVLRRSAELDGTILGIARSLPGPRRDLDVLYLPGLDIAQHALFTTPGEGAPAPSAVAARVDALRSYYAFLLRALAPFSTPAAKEVVIVVAQPGRVQSGATGILGVTQNHATIDMAAGQTARVVDAAPTVLYALGVPLSRELAGQPLRQLFGGADLNRSRERYVSTYGRPFTSPVPREGRPLDQEMIDRLRSLGYVK